jgi:hypothetical protein
MVELLQNPGKSQYKVYASGDQDNAHQRMPEVGSKKKWSDGREAVLVSTNVDVAAGQVVSAQPAAAELADKFTAASAGSREVTVAKASVTAGQYRDGHLIITAGAVETSYQIVNNTASGTSDAVVLTLAEPLVAAIVATDDCILVPSRYHNVVIGTATSDGVGVALNATTAGSVSGDGYIWVQTKGVAAVRVGTAAALTKGVKCILGAAGVVEAQSGAGVQKEFGHVVAAGAVSDGDCTAVRVCFE